MQHNLQQHHLSPMLPSQRGAMRPFEVMEAFREAAALEEEGHDIAHMSLGQPGVKVPSDVLEHVYTQMQHSSLGYTDACGLPDLRARIARYYRESYDLDIPPSRIFITMGSSAGFLLSLLVRFDVGARIAIARPCYPAYPNMMQALGLEPVWLDGDEAQGFQPNSALLDQHDHLDGLIIASPSNPTGSVITPDALAALTAYCRNRGIQLLSDEIYHHVVYEDVAFDTVQRYDNTAITLNSFSKFFLLPGWRLGWVVMPELLCRNVESLLQSFFISPSAIAQQAALAVMEHQDVLHQVVAGYARNRDRLKPVLETLGFTGLARAQGAFYLYANSTAFAADSKAFCRAMLHEAHICAVPGCDFDQRRGGDYVRFSFCGDEATIEKACDRLAKWLG